MTDCTLRFLLGSELKCERGWRTLRRRLGTLAAVEAKGAWVSLVGQVRGVGSVRVGLSHADVAWGTVTHDMSSRAEFRVDAGSAIRRVTPARAGRCSVESVLAQLPVWVGRVAITVVIGLASELLATVFAVLTDGAGLAS